MEPASKTKLINTIIKGLPGRTSEAYTMSSFVEAVSVRLLNAVTGRFFKAFILKSKYFERK